MDAKALCTLIGSVSCGTDQDKFSQAAIWACYPGSPVRTHVHHSYARQEQSWLFYMPKSCQTTCSVPMSQLHPICAHSQGTSEFPAVVQQCVSLPVTTYTDCLRRPKHRKGWRCSLAYTETGYECPLKAATRCVLHLC